MPDGDRVHPTLNRCYYKPYKQLCEGHFGTKVIAQSILKPLKQNLQHYGDAPISLIKKAADILSEIQESLDANLAVDWGQGQRELETLIFKVRGNKRGVGLALKVAQQQLGELRKGQFSTDMIFDLTQNYITKIYKADFESLVFSTSSHHNGISSAVLDERLGKVRPDVQNGICKFTEQLIKNKKLNKLRLSTNKSSRPLLTANTSIFELFKNRI